MSKIETEVKFDRQEISEKAYEELIECFSLIGFIPVPLAVVELSRKEYPHTTPYSTGKWAEIRRYLRGPDKTFMNIENEGINWAEREKLCSLGGSPDMSEDMFIIDFAAAQSSDMRISLSIRPLAAKVANTMSFYRTIAFSFSEYDEVSKDMTLRLNALVKEIYNRFKVKEIEGLNEHSDDEVYFYSEERRRELRELPLSDCHTLHLVNWAANPDGEVEDYYKCKGPFPDDPNMKGKEWSPVLPFQYDKESKEFHLLYKEKDKEDRYTLVRNCPCCGGEFPKSKRDEQFGSLTSDEEMEIRRTAVFFAHYARGADWWGIASLKSISPLRLLFTVYAAEALDEIPNDEAINFLNKYYYLSPT